MTAIGQEQLWFFALLLTIPRILGAFLAMPFLGSTLLPGLVRNGIVVIVSAFAVPVSIDSVAQIPTDGLQIAFIIIKEVAIGFMFGYLISIPFWAASSAGFFIDLQRGSLSAQMFSNFLSDQTSPLGDLFTKLAVVLLFTSGGFLLLLEILFKSYLTWPIHSFFPELSLDDAGFFLAQFASVFYIAMLIAGPVIATMFIVEMGSAVVSRYVPQLNIFLLLMPIKSGIAMLILVFYITYIARYLQESFLKFGDTFGMLEKVFQ